MKQKNESSVPLAKAYFLGELPGWLGKKLSVPAGKQGIVIDADGKCRLFTSGQSKILNPLDRINGEGIGLCTGYIPAKEFEISAHFENMLTGDDEFLDADLLFILKASNPEVFFTKVVLPEREIYDLPHLGNGAIEHLVSKVILQYAREDLLIRIPTENLANEIISELRDSFTLFGLQILDIPLLLFRRSEDRLLVDEKMAELGNHLEENQETSDVQVAITQASREILPGSISLRARTKRPLSEVIQGIHVFRKMRDRPKGNWLTKALRAPDISELDEKSRQSLRKWRRLKLRWAGILIALGMVVMYILYRLGINLKSEATIAFLFGIWSLLISLVVNTLKQLVEKEEMILFGIKNWKDLQSIHIVSQKDRSELDGLVRGQCSNQIQHTLEVVNGCRASVYREGNQDLALQLKELEKKLEKTRDQVLNADFGKPFYISEIPVNESDWKKILDEEEELITLSCGLGTAVENFRMNLMKANVQVVEAIEKQLYLLEDQFRDRSRLG